jgi:hypothetical protein
MCCKTTRLQGTELVPRKQERKNERRETERKGNFKVKSHIYPHNLM